MFFNDSNSLIRRCLSAGAPVLCVWLLLVGAHSPARADVSLQWQPGTTEVDVQVADTLADSNVLTDFVTMIEQNFTLDPPLVLVVGSGAGPDYDAQSHVLRIPYQYLADTIEAQSQLVESRKEALDRALDMFEYTLYVLFGQALSSAAVQPQTSPLADAETLATWIVVSQWRNGGEQWLRSIDAFGDASQKLDGPLTDFWHAYSLYRLRQSTLRCLVLGSNPKAYEPLLEAVADPAEREQRCVERWHLLDQTALKALDGLLKDGAPLRS